MPPFLVFYLMTGKASICIGASSAHCETSQANPAANGEHDQMAEAGNELAASDRLNMGETPEMGQA
jgi:hypothetical protein